MLFAHIRAFASAFPAAMLVFALLVSIKGTALAQQTPEEARFDDWTIRCSEVENGADDCWLIQTLVEKGTNSFIAEIKLAATGSTDDLQYVMVMSAPPGILLTARPAFRIDGAAEGNPMNWHNCSATRCEAAKTLTAGEVLTLRRGAQMVIGYQRFMEPEPTVFAVSLGGVTAGLAALSNLQAQ